MKSSRVRLDIEQLEDRTCPSSVDIGTATGSVHFDVAGYTFFQNGGVTFSTTSSAFGFSEVSMNQSQQVTTLNGGMVLSRLNDGYDGALTFGIPNQGSGTPNTTTYHDAGGMADISGAPFSGTPGNIHINGPGGILTGVPQTNVFGNTGQDFGSAAGLPAGSLRLSQQNAVFALDSTTPVVRSIGIVTNTTAAPVTVLVGFNNNLGSDSNTTIFATSNGGAFTPGVTRWIGSFQNYSGTTSSDPRLMFGLQGTGNVRSPLDATSSYANGNDNPQFNYKLTIPAGKTRRVMVFNLLTGSKPKATQLAHIFDSNATVFSNGLLAGLSPQDLSEIANWDFSGTPTVTGVNAPNVTDQSAPNPFPFTVTFSDPLAIDPTTLSNTNLVVTGPNGFSEAATFVSATSNSPTTPITATYSIVPPGGTWDFTDNGLYTINLQANQVGNVEGNFAAAGAIGAFNVTLTPPPTPPVQNGLIAVGSDAGVPAEVKVYDAGTGALKYDLHPFGNFTGGARVAVGDVNHDGTPDIIVGAGPHGGPQVNIYDGKTGQLTRAFYGITPTGFTGGVFVAAGDVNGDGFADVIVGADAGGGPQVDVFSGKDGKLLESFDAFPATFTGGVRVGAGDVNGDGKADIVTGAGAGGGPQVTVYSGTNLAVLQNFFAFPSTFTGGVYVAAGDVNNDGKAEVIVGAGESQAKTSFRFLQPNPVDFIGPLVSIFSSDGSAPTTFAAYPPGFAGGVRVGSVLSNGKVALLTGAGPGGSPEVKAFTGDTMAVLDDFFAFSQLFPGGVFVGG